MDRSEMLKAFDETKAGVKGLTDSGIFKVPKIFVRPCEELDQESTLLKSQIQVPLIDLEEIQNSERRRKVVEQIKAASETWGFFQVLNHGIPLKVLDGMINGVQGFMEGDLEEKKKHYTRDHTKPLRFNSNHDLFTTRTASWRDTLTIACNPINPNDLPLSCRDSTVEYSNHIEKLGNLLLGLLSEGLGLETNHLKDMEISEGHRLVCNYYPPCPEPELTIGIGKHSDPGFLTILLQNQITTGLQVMYKGQWINIEPVHGGLVINIGDFLQLVSNGRFKSIEHRAISTKIGGRISVACFFSGPLHINLSKIFGPIEELITLENPPIYRDVTLSEYVHKFLTTALDNYRALDYYRV